MKRKQFLASLLALVAAPVVAKQIIEEKPVAKELPFKDMGMMIPQGNGRYVHYMHNGKTYYYDKGMADQIERFERNQELAMFKTFRLR